MKKSIFVLSLAYISLTAAFAQNSNQQTVSPTLTHATVFLNRAELTATAKATVTAGEQRLVIENIPQSIDQNSIQVKGSGNAVITGVRFVQNYLQNAPRPKNILQLDDTLRTVQDDIAAAELSRSVLEEEKLLILANKQVSGTATGVKVADLKDMANFYRERLTDIGAKLIKVKELLKDLQQRENNLKNQLSNWQNSRNRPTGGIEVSLTTTVRTALDLEISYVVRGAGWRPVYDLRVKETNAPVALAYKAEVFQNTGQNWDNVKLTLSTSNPALGGVMPTLGVQYVDFPQPVVMRNERARFSKEAAISMNAQAVPMDSEAFGAPMADVQTTADFTQITTNDLSVSFD
ncbi:mucoidy inhibitor MuiA family protein, partial [Persicitalea sp.]|uniref:mucoidy inhibitor MuiA family protein n=1 Tax=Persicitalea sp. TaxID=3100273 RepID=UPI00359365A7